MPPDVPPILFQDDRFLILNKPAGLPVHATRDGGPCVEDLFPILSRRRTGPWLAHRLDRDTAGCLLIALRRAALLAAQSAFAAGTVEKTYWAVVQGIPRQTGGRIEIGLRKHSTAHSWRMIATPDGATSVSDWRVLGTGDNTTWIEIRPRTGRTHQIRAHLAWLGHPILGDKIYGTPQFSAPLHLLARSLRVPLSPPVAADAKPPTHMHQGLLCCGWKTE